MRSDPTPNAGPGSVVAAFFYGLYLLFKLAGQIVAYVMLPAAVVIVIGAWRWTTGARLLGSGQPGPDLLTRPVRATLRALVTIAVAGALLAPIITVVATAGLTLAGTIAVIVARHRTRALLGPRRVTAHTGAPIRVTATVGTATRQTGHSGTAPAARCALPAQRADRAWTEVTVTGPGRAA